VKHVKQLVDGSTITHLGHAAMVLALVRCNPPKTMPTSESLPLISPCWLNGLRYLLASPGHPKPTEDYIPLCISFAPIIFPDIKEFWVSKRARKAEMKFKLLKAWRIATEEYRKINNRPCPLSACIVLFEDLAKKMR
jgi:15-O-acetyltransferase Tri3